MKKISKLVLSICFAITSILFVSAQQIDKEVDDFISYDQRPEKIAYLTFDDGPSIHTEKLLNVLKQYRVPAIFFVTGDSIDIMTNGRGKTLLNRILEEGHHIGYHSISHNREKLYFRPDSPQYFLQEMRECQQKVSELTDGYWSSLCRAPYGKMSHFQKGHWPVVENSEFYCIDWNIDSLDWAKNHTGAIYNQVLAALQQENYPDQVVLLFHEKDITANALPSIIEYIRSKGYTFVPYVEGEIIQVLEK